MVGIVCFWDRLATPYLAKYESLLQKNNIDYEIIFWNRLLSNDSSTVTQDRNCIFINRFCPAGVAKLVSFLRWRCDVLKILKGKKYDRLIILSTVPAVLIAPYILRNYKEKYIFDIRDYTLEANLFFRKIVMLLIKSSCLTAISSKGFLRWLEPSDKIMVNHNITIDNSVNFDAPDFSLNNKIKFSFVGNVRLDLQTRAMLISLGKSSTIEQHYYGRVLPSCDINDLITDKCISNVFIHGPFSRQDKYNIYKNTDLINTVYVNSVLEKDIPLGDSTPLPNRLYDSLIFYRPLVTSKGTYLAELAEIYHLGVNVNGFDDDIEAQILEYTKSFNKKEFIAGCNKLKEQVLKEEEEFVSKVKSIIKNWN